MLDELRQVPLLADLSEEDLERLFEMAETVSVPAGQFVLREGDAGDSLYIVLEGKLEATRRRGGQEVVLSSYEPGQYFGEMALLERAPRSASVRTLRESRLLAIDQAAFRTLLSRSPSAPFNILRTVTSRLRSTESMLIQNEKMAALGTLAAGLAHELNNPSSAIQRSVAQLRDALADLERSAAEIGSLSEEELGALRVEAMTHGPATHPYDPLALSEREDELQGWLEDHGVGQPWELAPVLASFGWKRDEVERLAIRFSPGKLPIVVRWLAATSSVHGLLADVGRGAEAISEIVEAVKAYSYLDQAPIQEVDVRETLENSLVLLRPKLKMGVTIRRDYAEGVPRVEAYGSELNQVWTNIIDNAIDAVQGKGELELRTYPADGTVVIEITDDGPGIPPEIRQRIFDPFFTTKGPGAGTGLGLHIAYNIVVHKHHGQIQVTSRAGETRLRVILPVRLDRE